MDLLDLLDFSFIYFIFYFLNFLNFQVSFLLIFQSWRFSFAVLSFLWWGKMKFCVVEVTQWKENVWSFLCMRWLNRGCGIKSMRPIWWADCHALSTLGGAAFKRLRLDWAGRACYLYTSPSLCPCADTCRFLFSPLIDSEGTCIPTKTLLSLPWCGFTVPATPTSGHAAHWRNPTCRTPVGIQTNV